MKGQGLDASQQDATVALIRWLMATYHVKIEGITGHRFAPGNEGSTDCPDRLFGDPTKEALDNWVRANLA